MRILCLNPALSMRAVREMKALHQRGHEISLIYLGEGESIKMIKGDFWKKKERTSFGRYPLSHIPGTLSPGRYRKIVEDATKEKDYDIVHSFSSPDVLGAAAARYSKVPTIFDVRDMVTAFRMDVLKNYIPESLLKFSPIYRIGLSTFFRRIMKIEREANLGSSGRIYVSDYTMELARKLHSIPEERSILFYNYAMMDDIKEPLKKLSSEDGEVHVAYAGVLSLKGYRSDVLGVLKEISKMGIHIHIFGIGSDEVLEAYRAPGKDSEHYHFEGSVPKEDLMKLLTRYDYGLIPFIPKGTESEYLHTMMPLKMFDYLAAGLPLIAPDTRSLTFFIERTSTGHIFKDISEIKGAVKGDVPDIKREDFVIEKRIEAVEDLYKEVLSHQ